MGVPVISLLGDRHAGRVGYSLLANTGLQALVVQDEISYLDKAVELTKDVAALRTFRSELRERLRHSPLLDARAFTLELEQGYRQCWAAWRHQQAIAPSGVS